MRRAVNSPNKPKAIPYRPKRAALLGLGYAYRRFGFDPPAEVTARDGP